MEERSELSAQHGQPTATPSNHTAALPQYTLQAELHLPPQKNEGILPAVTSVKFSPDGKYLATALANGLICVWSPESATLLHTLKGHKQGISDVSWAPDSQHICSASDDTEIKIWDAIKGVAVGLLHGHTVVVLCVCYNPHSTLVASGAEDGTLRLWDVMTGRCLMLINAHSDPVTCVTFNTDGANVASCSYDGLVRIWNTENGTCIRTIYEYSNPPLGHIMYSKDSKYILASYLNSQIRLWNSHNGKCLKVYSGHHNVRLCCFSALADEDTHPLVLSGSEDGRILIWDMQSMTQLQVLEGHTDIAISISHNPTSGQFASGSVDGTLKIWKRIK